MRAVSLYSACCLLMELRPSSAWRSVSAFSSAAISSLAGSAGGALRFSSGAFSSRACPRSFLLCFGCVDAVGHGFPVHVGHEGAQILGGHAADLPRQAVDLSVPVYEDVVASVRPWRRSGRALQVQPGTPARLSLCR